MEDLFQEAVKRGLIPDDMLGLFGEAKTRGILNLPGGMVTPTPTSLTDATEPPTVPVKSEKGYNPYLDTLQPQETRSIAPKPPEPGRNLLNKHLPGITKEGTTDLKRRMQEFSDTPVLEKTDTGFKVNPKSTENLVPFITMTQPLGESPKIKSIKPQTLPEKAAALDPSNPVRYVGDQMGYHMFQQEPPGVGSFMMKPGETLEQAFERAKARYESKK